MNGTLTNKEMINLNNNIMRKLVFALLMLLTLSLSAQDNVMKFMGIPLDGPKSAFIAGLEEKGFVPTNNQRELDRLGDYRDNEDFYSMQGYFDGNKCNLFIFPYKSNVFKVKVHFDSGIIPYRENEAKQIFNHYVEQLNKKYESKFDNDSFYLRKDISEPIEAHYYAYYIVKDDSNKEIGTITLEMTHPAAKEFHIVFYYCNTNNMPNGDDL